MNIGVLGAGSWGTTLAILLSNNAHAVTLWSHKDEYVQMMLQQRENTSFLPGIPIPSSIEITGKIQQAVREKEMIVLAVPAQYLRSVLATIRDEDVRTSMFINVAKGIETTTLQTMSEVIAEVFPQHNSTLIATLSGPSHAEEVSENYPTLVVVASSNIEMSKIVQHTFMTERFRVYTSTDLRGVELGGSLKNVIAIAAGIVDGAGFGDNTKAALISRGLAEMTRLGVAMGATEKTFYGLSGIGDLVVTCNSKHSRNRHVGEQMGKGRKLEFVLREMEMVAEGVGTTRSAFLLAQKYSIEMPIASETHAILFEGKDAHIATNDLMTRLAKGE
ncbi:MAG: NAD(P)H-dependent glycerol-3-phosphate dehydrogenase [Bacteroidota bacterium]